MFPWNRSMYHPSKSTCHFLSCALTLTSTISAAETKLGVKMCVKRCWPRNLYSGLVLTEMPSIVATVGAALCEHSTKVRLLTMRRDPIPVPWLADLCSGGRGCRQLPQESPAVAAGPHSRRVLSESSCCSQSQLLTHLCLNK